MDILPIFFAQLNKAPYTLWSHNGGYIARFQEGLSVFQGRNLYIMIESDPANLSGNEDVFEVLAFNGVDYICPISDRSLNRAKVTDPWREFAQQNYVESTTGMLGAPLVPRYLNIGDHGELATQGTWTWFDDNGNIGSGSWQYHNVWELSFGRLVIDEDWNQQTDGQEGNTRSYRRHQFDMTYGRMGFKDMMTGDLDVLQSWVGH